jgi:hypothetical protein
MDLKFNGSITQSWRSSLLGFFSAFGFIAYAVAEAAGAHPSVKLWSLVVGAVCGALAAFFSGDHVRFIAELKNLAKAVADVRAMLAQAEAAKANAPAVPPAAAPSPIPELDVPLSLEPGAPQDTIPEAPPVAMSLPGKEPR